MAAARPARPSPSSHSTMRVARRGTSGANRSSNRLSGTERASSKWLCEKISSSRTSISASSPPSLNMPRRAEAPTDAVTSCSRDLLRGDRLLFAGLEVEAHAMDFVEIGPGHADEAGIIGIIDRMDFAVLINTGMAGRQAVFLHRLELGVRRIAAIVLALPFDHVGVMGRLAVDRPGLAVVVQWRDPRLIVDVGKNLKAELGILIEHLQSARHVVSRMPADKVRVAQQAFEIFPHLFAAFRPGVTRKAGTAIRYELIEFISHGAYSWVCFP